MSNVNIPQDYDAKVKRMADTCNLTVPDRVPILSMNITWSFSYAGVKIPNVLQDNEKHIEAALRYCKDIYSDMLFGTGLTMPFQMYEVLKPPHPVYKFTEDGYAFTHQQANEKHIGMSPDEYPELIADTRKFFVNKILPRRYPVLAEPYPKNYEVMKETYAAGMKYLELMVQGADYAKKVYGLPTLFSTIVLAPLDFLFDSFRGMAGISADMRRRPDDVIAACDAIESYCEKTSLARLKKGEYVFIPTHIPPFLGRRNFDKFYWPSFKKLIDFIVSKRAKVAIILEGDWTPYMDCLREFPKCTFLSMIDQGDIFEMKKNYGDIMTLAGGMPIEMLRYSSKQECCDYAKKLIDGCGPGGGYVFMTDKGLMYPNDVNVDNFIAVIETVKEYGRY